MQSYGDHQREIIVKAIPNVPWCVRMSAFPFGTLPCCARTQAWPLEKGPLFVGGGICVTRTPPKPAQVVFPTAPPESCPKPPHSLSGHRPHSFQQLGTQVSEVWGLVQLKRARHTPRVFQRAKSLGLRFSASSAASAPSPSSISWNAVTPELFQDLLQLVLWRFGGGFLFTLRKNQGLKSPDHQSKPPSRGYLSLVAYAHAKKLKINLNTRSLAGIEGYNEAQKFGRSPSLRILWRKPLLKPVGFQ